MRIFLFFGLIILSQSTFAQKIYGTVFNANGELMPYSSVTIKGTTRGTSANDKAKYAFNVSPGIYTIVCQHLGYASSEKTIIVKSDEELSFILTEQKLSLETVIIKSGGEDPAYEIIRNAIKKRHYYQKQVNKFTCNIYGKDMIKLRALPKKIFGQKVPDADRKEMGLDSTGRGIIYLSESVSKVSVQQPDKIKLEVTSSRVSGSGGFGFNFPSFISLYNSNVKIFTEKFNLRGFVSPIANGAISFYKFKFLGTFFENGRSYSSIRVTPRRKYEPLFSGIINITDDEWSIYSFDLMLTKTSQLEILDTLQIVQLHIPVTKEIRRVKNQLIHFNFKQFGIDALGNFLTVYSDYNVSPVFSKKYFDNVIIKYDTGVNKKSVAYWDSTRAVPLEKEEEMDYRKKDSIYKSNKDSLLSKRSIDSLNKNQPKVKPLDIFVKGINRFHLTKTQRYSWGIEPLLLNVEYNFAEGAVVNLKGNISNSGRGRSRNSVSFEPVIRYGFNNTHLNSYATLTFNTRNYDSAQKIKRQSWTFSGGKRVSDFNKEETVSLIGSSISNLLFGKNYYKTYENNYGNIIFRKRYENGLRLSAGLLFEDRIPLNNTTNFTIVKKDSINITPNYPYEKIASQFMPHRAFIANVSFNFQPGQQYIQFPNYKMSVGSKYPTFTIDYFKGIKNILGSDVDFDKWRFTIKDEKNLRLAGTLKYKFGIGGFLNNSKVPIQDYQHFNGNRRLRASEYVNSFQLASYYANSTTKPFYATGHAEQHLNGLLTNKIPLFRKLNWNLVAGSNAFFVNTGNHYLEIFGGLENIFKIFRVDGVIGYDNNNKVTSGIRIGSGGLLGGSIKKGNSGRDVSIEF